MAFLFQRGLVLAKIETTFDTDAVPTPSTDAFLVMEPSFEPDITFLDRNNVKTSLSSDAPIAGRKLAKVSFKHEVRNNGNLLGTVPPKLDVLLRACGMQVTNVNSIPGGLAKLVKFAANNPLNTSSIVVSGKYDQPTLRRVTVEMLSTGATPNIKITAPVEGDLPGVNVASVASASGTKVDVFDTAGTLVFSFTPTWSGTSTVGDKFGIELQPYGYYYTPRSSGFESITLYMYFPDDNGNALLHKITGARGSFSVEATGGQFGTFSFSFTGSYQTVTDVSMPTGPVYETQKPQQVELANLKLTTGEVESSVICAAQFTMDMAVTVQPRECLNSANAYAGALIVDRNPVMGMDPETVLEATHPFWSNLENATGVEFQARVGRKKGNTVLFYAGNVVTSGLTYKERNSIRAYDFKGSMSAVSSAGDDEVQIGFV